MQHYAGFISAESLYMFRASSAHHREYLKLVQRPLVHVLSLQVSHHITLLFDLYYDARKHKIKKK